MYEPKPLLSHCGGQAKMTESTMPPAASVQTRFESALDELARSFRKDRSILAAILCGSLSHDMVWSKSDIDLALVTVDDKAIESSDIALNANGVNVHVFLMPRAEFRKTVEGSLRNSFMHSMLAKGKLLYTHDETITALCARLGEIGERDTQLQLLSAASGVIRCIDKAHKWFVTRNDLEYTALWILYAATPLARIEVLSARELAGREVIQQALQLNPGFFHTIYTQVLNTKKTRKNVQQALDAIDEYLAMHAARVCRPILDYLREAGEARSATEIEAHFKRNFNLESVTTACEYLADQGLITKASIAAQLTRRSNVQVQELAFVYTSDDDEL
jgi:uncharacterized protein